MNGIAAVLSFIIPGLGQLYKGHLLRGILIFFGWIVLSITLIGSLIVWIWNIYDAYTLNRSKSSYVEVKH